MLELCSILLKPPWPCRSDSTSIHSSYTLFTMESMSGDMWKPPWCVLDSPSLPSEPPVISSSPSMLLRLLTLLLTDLQSKVEGENVLKAGRVGIDRFSPRFSLTCQARYLTNSMVDPVVDRTCMMLNLDPPWRPNLSNSTRPCYTILREFYCFPSTSMSPTTRLLDPSCSM